ncbi:HEAT repeat domain-containing protein [Corynebacterium glyciniphilum]|uniref:HEAT repeat domain-containing protein n=1 Tax=Corynebacterium glyciniphilum TaxID=1404244 RepID=UPI00264BDE1C|nr:HEAT repeat domain-containing protein [Corynebacterium glyciniphilum]MDN5683717.1 HEAT repeat domain-containing protein [Corynebacterium glyciniphilum]MDN6707335.1 HEAT repeat domain-containing protein [Corynebacterium glyciniphilum]
MNLNATDSSVRLRAALDAGTTPDPADTATVRELVARCAVEPDFFVRDMLTWALTRHPVSITLPPLLTELLSPTPQARAQALHTLSKIGEDSAYPHITDDLLGDADDDVARTAWRAAAGLVPTRDARQLATRLSTQLGRGPRELRRSLSRAFLQLGEAGRPVLDDASTADGVAAAHAAATLILLDDPDYGFDAAGYAVAHPE